MKEVELNKIEKIAVSLMNEKINSYRLELQSIYEHILTERGEDVKKNWIAQGGKLVCGDKE